MKRGEITTQQIITIIILVMSFAVILYFIFALDLGGTTDKEICHNSVVMSGKAKNLVGGLDCKTNYICISAGEDCAGMDKSANIKVDPADKDEILKVIADEMKDCWWMFGEGEIKYVSWGGAHCGICSVVKFSQGFDGEFVNYEDFNLYLQTEEYSEGSSESYLKYLYGINDYEKLFEVDKFGKDLKKKGNFANYLDSQIKTSETYLIVTGFNPKWDNGFVHVQFVEQDLVKEKTECSVFDVTKA